MKSKEHIRQLAQSYPISAKDKSAAAPKAAAFSILALVVCIGLTLLADGIFDIGFISTKVFAADDYSEGVNLGEGVLPSVNITFNVEGKTHAVNTTHTVLSALLTEYGITPDEDDYLSCPPDSVLEEDMVVTYDRYEHVEYDEEEIVKFKVVNNRVQTIKRGTKENVQVGSDGKNINHVKQVYKNGELFEENTSIDVIVPVVDEINNIGVGGSIVGNDGKTYTFSYYMDCEATAYAGPDLNPHTASGAAVELGMIAVDPLYIPLTSVCYVCTVDRKIDLGVMYAEDTGGRIKKNIIDIYMGSEEEDIEKAIQWGRRNVRVYVLDLQSPYHTKKK